MSEPKFCVDYANRGQAACKKCKQKLPKTSLRLAKLVPNHFSDDGGDMKNYYHPDCLFEVFERCRSTTKVIESTDDISNFSVLEDTDADHIKDLIKKLADVRSSKTKKSPIKSKPQKASTSGNIVSSIHSHDAFAFFTDLVNKIASVNGALQKTEIMKKVVDDVYEGDLYLLVKLLLPKCDQRVYNLHNKTLIKHFSRIFSLPEDEMADHFDQSGDASDTISYYFSKSTSVAPASSSTLTIKEVDDFLTSLSQPSAPLPRLTELVPKCTVDDLTMIIRLIRSDLKMNAGTKPILDALDPGAYEAYRSSTDLKSVIERVLERPTLGKKQISAHMNVLTPIKPMLAEACKSVEYALKKCPQGMFAEIKYDGERVQVHKSGSKFEYYSRSLKPVLPHKTAHIKDYLPLACPHGHSMILDSEVLLMDKDTSEPLPFGTLNIHKKNAFSSACVCLFVFDCLMFNGEDLTKKPIKYRRKILEENLTEVPHRILLSEAKVVHQREDLSQLIMKTIKKGLEGLVLKDINSVYEPGKRHWLKVKKDYLNEGAMADTADLVCLGGYYGTGVKGGIMSVFLMGCYSEADGKWCTVTKVSGGFSDAMLTKLNKELDMKKISRDSSLLPSWIKCNKQLTPDFVSSNPKTSPVWEITGAEFSKSENHSADGISIRFPRVSKFRDDKTWKEATSLERLKILFAKSKETSDIDVELLDDSPSTSQSPTKRKPVVANEVSTKKSRTTSLVDIFDDVKLYIPDDVPNKERLLRYVIAYNGEVVDAFAMEEDATHAICNNEDHADVLRESKALLVRDEWIYDCIRQMKKLPCSQFLYSK